MFGQTSDDSIMTTVAQEVIMIIDHRLRAGPRFCEAQGCTRLGLYMRPSPPFHSLPSPPFISLPFFPFPSLPFPLLSLPIRNKPLKCS